MGPDYPFLQFLPQIWAGLAERHSSLVALDDPHGHPPGRLTYAELYRGIQGFAAGLQSLGLLPGERVGLFADNSHRWLIADQGILTAGGVGVVRGSQASSEELLYILEDSQAVGLILQDASTFTKLQDYLPPLRFLILLTDESEAGVINFRQVLRDQPPEPVAYPSLATLMYTSGTSGKPKGVMTSHGNLLAQIRSSAQVLQPRPGERVLSILPIWHSYERTFEYFVLAHGCTQVYTSIRHIKKDLREYRPHYMVAVPRIWESLYEGIQKQFRERSPWQQALVKFLLARSHSYIHNRRTWQGLNLRHLYPNLLEKLVALGSSGLLWPLHWLAEQLVYRQVRLGTGGELKFAVSGGGSIAEHLEDFFEVVGLEILVGYGLTETSPITHVRRPQRNLRGADGQPLANTEARVVDPQTWQPQPPGQPGLVLVRGLQVMQGYHGKPEATAQVLDPQGWFNTGDLGWISTQGDLVITGRAKDTIVLSNGENIEPEAIEEACLRSPYIHQIMLVGQDQRSLGALIVPNWEALEGQEPTAIQELFRREITREVQSRPAYRPDERIGPFVLLEEPFSVENGQLTQTLKVRRSVVMERYQGMIDKMFA